MKRLCRDILVTLLTVGVAVGGESAALAQRGSISRLRARSGISGVVLATIDRLPRAPSSQRVDDFCKHYLIRPASSGARVANSRGWLITGEAQLGGLTAVSFAGDLEPATSGTCHVREGNVGIFDGDQLVALAYSARGSQQSLGKVSSLEGGAVRVWSGEPLMQPVGDLQVAGDRGEVLRLGSGPIKLDSFVIHRLLIRGTVPWVCFF